MMSSPLSRSRILARGAVAPLPNEPAAAPRRLRRRAVGLAGAGLWVLALLAGACGDDAAQAPSGDLTVDAGAISCQPGSESCVCVGGSGCEDGLLCIAGRCLETEDPSGTESPPRDRPRPNGIESNLPDLEQPDAAAPDAASRDGGAPDDAGDAG